MAADALQVDVAAAAVGAGPDERQHLAVGGERRVHLDARQVGELLEACPRGGRCRDGLRAPAPDEVAEAEQHQSRASPRAPAAPRGSRRGREPPRHSPSTPRSFRGFRGRRPGRAPTGSVRRASSRGSARTIRSNAGRNDAAGVARPAPAVLAQDRGHGLRRGVAAEGAAAAQHLVQHAAEAEDVGAVVDGVAAHLLGRHVADGARAPSRGRSRARASGTRKPRARRCRVLARQPEVEDLEAPVAGDEQVLGLEVAVDDALVVRRREARSGLAPRTQPPFAAAAARRAARRAGSAPSSSSITAYAIVPAWPRSWIARMFGWESAATMRASRSKRARASWFSASRSGSTLTATSRSRFVSRAR